MLILWTQPNKYVLEGRASNQGTIDQNFFLKFDINLIRPFLYQTEFYPISKLQFEISEAIRILNISTYVMLFQSSDTFHKECSEFDFHIYYS
jgi:hypothetical protein